MLSFQSNCSLFRLAREESKKATKLQLSHGQQNVENSRYQQQESGTRLPGSIQAHPYGHTGKQQGHKTDWTMNVLMVFSKIKL